VDIFNKFINYKKQPNYKEDNNKNSTCYWRCSL